MQPNLRRKGNLNSRVLPDLSISAGRSHLFVVREHTPSCKCFMLCAWTSRLAFPFLKQTNLVAFDWSLCFMKLLFWTCFAIQFSISYMFLHLECRIVLNFQLAKGRPPHHSGFLFLPPASDDKFPLFLLSLFQRWIPESPSGAVLPGQYLLLRREQVLNILGHVRPLQVSSWVLSWLFFF